MNVPGHEPLRSMFKKLDPFRKYGAVYVGSTADGVPLALRPFWIVSDLLTVNKWPLPDQVSRQRRLKHYMDLLESDQAQCLVVLLQEQPVLQADFFRLSSNDDQFPVAVQPGGVRLHFIAAAQAIAHKQLFTGALRTCLGYFFSFEGAERVFTRLPAEAVALYPYLEPAGFVPVKSRQAEPGSGVLYCCGRKDWETGNSETEK